MKLRRSKKLSFPIIIPEEQDAMAVLGKLQDAAKKAADAFADAAGTSKAVAAQQAMLAAQKLLVEKQKELAPILKACDAEKKSVRHYVACLQFNTVGDIKSAADVVAALKADAASAPSATP
jgi:hypothetical protein